MTKLARQFSCAHLKAADLTVIESTEVFRILFVDDFLRKSLLELKDEYINHFLIK